MKRMSRKYKMKWEENVMESPEKGFKRYSFAESFYKGDLILHDHFGKGCVESSFGNKIEVLFKDKIRTLVHRVVF